jgi:uncharacterized membrane protein
MQGAFASPLSFAVTGAPTGTTATVSTSGLATTVQVTTPITLAATSYCITVKASSGTFSASIPVAVTVAASNFTMTGSVSTLNIMAGQNGTASATITHHGVFNSALSLSWSGLPAGVTAALARSSMSPPGDGTDTTTFTIAATATPGTYSATLTATGGGVTQTVPLSLTIAPIPSLTLNVGYPVTPMSMYPGTSDPIVVYPSNVQGTFAAPLAVTLTGAPAGVTATLSTTSFLPNSAGVTVQVAVAQTVDVGTINLTLTATSGSFTKSVPITIPLYVNNFTLAAAQTEITIKQGATGQVSATTAHLSLFSRTLTLAWSGLPTGVTAALSAGSIPAPGDGTSVTTFTVASTAKTGTYTATLTATGNAWVYNAQGVLTYSTMTQTAPVTITVASK